MIKSKKDDLGKEMNEILTLVERIAAKLGMVVIVSENTILKTLDEIEEKIPAEFESIESLHGEIEHLEIMVEELESENNSLTHEVEKLEDEIKEQKNKDVEVKK